MSDADDQYYQNLVPDLVNDSIVADPNAPQLAAPLELLRARRTRVVRERVDARTQSELNLAREFAELALRIRRDSTLQAIALSVEA